MFDLSDKTIMNSKYKLLDILLAGQEESNIGIYRILKYRDQEIRNYIKEKLEKQIDERLTNYIAFTSKTPDSNPNSVNLGSITHFILKQLTKFFNKWYRNGTFLGKNSDVEYRKELDWLSNDFYFYSNKNNNLDYFIYKDLDGLLKRNLDEYIKQYILNAEELDKVKIESLTLNFLKIRFFKEICYEIIDILAHFEEFKLKLWLKKKIVVNTDYVITLNRLKDLVGEEYLKNTINVILANQSQLAEWKDLLKIDVKTEKDLIAKIEVVEGRIYKELPIDTKFFNDEFKWALIEQVSDKYNFDDCIDGVLVKSENFQAMSLILKKWKKKVQTIFIDPPFNVGSNDFLYKNAYSNSSWNTMLYNRLNIGRDFLSESGSIFVRIDTRKNHFVRFMMDMVFGEDNFRNQIVITRTKAKQRIKKPFITRTENLFFYSITKNYYFNPLEVPKASNEVKWLPLVDFPRKNENPRTVEGRTFYPPKNRRWGISQKRIDRLFKVGKVRIDETLSYVDCHEKKVKGRPIVLYDTDPVRDVWLDIEGYSQTQHFTGENSEELLQRVIESTSKEGDVVFDYFLGSGTTTAVAHKLNRKWIGIEMEDHFDDIVLRRMKKVLYGEKIGLSKKNEVKKGGFFEYHRLEQFEDTIENIDYKAQAIKSDKLEQINVEIISTIDYLFGIYKHKIKKIKANNSIYLYIYGELDSRKIVFVLRSLKNETKFDFKDDKNLILENIKEFNPDEIYVNGECLIDGFKPIESEIENLMWS
ncbi:MAG: DNA methyltransferase [Candidatus Hermodarchaeota archaeon]